MRLRKTLIAVGLAGAVAAVVVAGTAFAQTPTPQANPKGGSDYQSFFLDRLANALGTTRDKLTSAFTQARDETVDQAVKDGKLSQQQADKVKAQKGVAPFGLGFRGFDRGNEGRGNGFFMGGPQVMDAIAKALGMTTQDLMTQLRSGKKLADLAQGKEQAVKDAIVAVEKPRLDEAVKNGRITQDQENQMLDKIQKSDLSNIGGVPRAGGKGMRGEPNRQKQAPNAKPSSGPNRSGAGAL